MVVKKRMTMKVILINIILVILLTSFSCDKNKVQIDNSGIDIIESSTLASHNFIIEHFTNVENRIENRDFGNLSSLIIIHDDELVYEKYYDSNSRSDLQYIASDTKSITSLVFGIAKDKGYISTLEEKVYDIFSSYDINEYDDIKKELSIEHLLTMTAGYQWDEWIHLIATLIIPTHN